jgi:hypothetical protein
VVPLEGGGTYQAEWIPERPGAIELELVAPEGGDAWFQTRFEVEGDVPEEIGIPVKPALLREMAQITGGRSVGVEAAAGLLAELRELPQRQLVLTVTRLWQHPLWVSAVFVFFGLYWILRKRQGWI